MELPASLKFTMLTDSLKRLIEWIADTAPAQSWLNNYLTVKMLFAFVLACLICGTVGSLVVSNRMAFFSDALAHCAFAGVTLGILLSLARHDVGSMDWNYIVPIVMVAFGVIVGLAIAWVKENSALANDTIIGVFFAGAIGLGAMMVSLLNRSTYVSPESFMFGSGVHAFEQEILLLVALLGLLVFALVLMFNSIVFASFSSSLARSRGIRVRLGNYLFIVLLALIVNLCITIVGALLINAMLVVPAATAVNLSRSVRHVFWWGIGLSVAAAVTGLWLSDVILIPMDRGPSIQFGPSGTIVVLCVIAFFVSLAYRILRDRRIPSGAVPRPALRA